ncbi:hypothetical protein [Paraburkholderia bannensis]|uniref:hypothetical protein n=1 Tax=Paraburkholderia bannensis TaxID=765414 RepID=UPI002AC319F8|nr:hypothetical protein [Paraburkholderia bannensis]
MPYATAAGFHVRGTANTIDVQPFSPLPQSAMVDVLLAAHLSFVACRSGKGSRHLLFELVHMTYLSYFLWKAGFGEAEQNTYALAEKALDAGAHEGYRSGNWSIPAESEDAIRPILSLYDRQIQQVPLSCLNDAKAKLKELFKELREHAQA